MIKIFLTSYKGNFRNQLNFISENAWMYHINEICITDDFFMDWIDMEYYPLFLDKKENIKFRYVTDADKMIDVSEITLENLTNYYVSSNNYYLDFYDLIENINDNMRYFIQLINRYNFKKIKIGSDILREKIFIYINDKKFYYFIINNLDHIITHDNTVEIVLFSNKITKEDNFYKILPGGFIMYYNNNL